MEAARIQDQRTVEQVEEQMELRGLQEVRAYVRDLHLQVEEELNRQVELLEQVLQQARH